MAKMIPLELNDGDYLSYAEKEAFYILKNGLSDEWIVIYSLRWITDDDIFLDKSEGESDFVLIHPSYGVLILEVKGGIINCINGQWSSVASDNTRRFIKNPEKQANDAKFNLLNIFRKNNVNPYITTAVWFPDCVVDKCSLPLSLNKKVVLDMNSFEYIEKKIIGIFKYRSEKEGFIVNKLIESDYKKIIDILNPKVKIKIPLLRLTKKLNMKFMKLTKEQNEFFQQLDDNKFISVKGHAGTGKTVLAIKKAFRESENGKNVLFICYNNLLWENLNKESEGAFKIFTMHSLALEYLKKFNQESFNRFEEVADYNEMMEDFIKEVKNNRSKHKMFFDSIIIDEGQDFTEEWFNAVNNLLSDNGSLCVFYDENQMLYNKYGRTDISFLDKGTKYTLMRNMRNTDEICLSSLNVINANKNTIKLNGINGIKPDIIFSENNFYTETHLKDIIIQLKKKEYLSDSNITVLTMEARKKIKIRKSIANEFNGTVESIRRFKGLESDIVIIPDLNNDFMEDEDLRNLLYVGMSRAKAHVILIINIEPLNRKQRASYKKEIKEMLL